jgi:hypothetical protein
MFEIADKFFDMVLSDYSSLAQRPNPNPAALAKYSAFLRGYERGLTRGANQMFNVLYKVGLEDGYDAGFVAGYKVGFTAGLALATGKVIQVDGKRYSIPLQGRTVQVHSLVF